MEIEQLISIEVGQIWQGVCIYENDGKFQGGDCIIKILAIETQVKSEVTEVWTTYQETFENKTAILKSLHLHDMIYDGFWLIESS